MKASAKENFDVSVIGAGLAGCTAARLFALKGLEVALVEHHADMQAFKQLCTHFNQASATPPGTPDCARCTDAVPGEFV